MTILLQVNEVEGLQIRKDVRWVPVEPLPNAFIINIGDIMEVLCLSIPQFYGINWFKKMAEVPLALTMSILNE